MISLNRSRAESTVRAPEAEIAPRQASLTDAHSAIAPRLASEVSMPDAVRASARHPIVLSLHVYRAQGAVDAHACFNCGCVDVPRPRSIREVASGAIERSCRSCGLPCALPLDQAVREGWLRVEVLR